MQKPPRVRMSRAVYYLLCCPDLDDLTGVHNRKPVRDFSCRAEVMRNKENAHLSFITDPEQQVQDVVFDILVEGCRRFVGDQELRILRQRHSQHASLPHSSGQHPRINIEPILCFVDAYILHEFYCFCAERFLRILFACIIPVRSDGFRDLPSYRVGRIERSERVLKDNGNLASAHPAVLPVRIARRLAAAYHNAPGSDLRLPRKNPHNRLAEDALAAAGFPCDSNNLPLPNGQGEIAHGTCFSPFCVEYNGKVLYF